jgi:calcineurin-like phosphoesterase family protein
MAIYYTADPHFFHENIIRFCSRPFGNVEDMNAALIENWNRVVQPGDIVYVVGDFAYKMASSVALQEVFQRLRGDKHLIRGNHDGRDVERLRWSSISDAKWVTDGDKQVYLHHYGTREFPNFYRGNTVHLYGHSHARLPGNSRSDDCGVDAQARYRALEEGRYLRPDDYRPVLLSEMLPRIQARSPYDPSAKITFPVDPDMPGLPPLPRRSA